jgi:uncharacterized protein YdhG (YjbR/CyaY superfamily)
MKRLYIDFDGVILDTIPPLYEELDKAHIDPKWDDEARSFIKAFDFKKIIKDEYILNDSINKIGKILDSNMFEVSILTHVNSLEEAETKIKYIRKYFNQMTILIVPKSVSKTDIIHTEGAILIDDYAGNLREWESKGGIGVRFSKELESKGFKVLNKLDEIINMFKEQ